VSMDLKEMKQQEDGQNYTVSCIICTVHLISLLGCEDVDQVNMPQDRVVQCALL
jgi:hypothetical protein